jgi:hypothetical protein
LAERGHFEWYLQLSEGRKFGISLFLTHQYIGQLQQQIQAAIFGNVGTVIVFAIGSEDAKLLEKEFYHIFSESDFINLPRYHMYIRLMIDGVTSKPFSACTDSLTHKKFCNKESIKQKNKKYVTQERDIQFYRKENDRNFQLHLF